MGIHTARIDLSQGIPNYTMSETSSNIIPFLFTITEHDHVASSGDVLATPTEHQSASASASASAFNPAKAYRGGTQLSHSNKFDTWFRSAVTEFSITPTGDYSSLGQRLSSEAQRRWTQGSGWQKRMWVAEGSGEYDPALELLTDLAIALVQHDGVLDQSSVPEELKATLRGSCRDAFLTRYYARRKVFQCIKGIVESEK